MKLIELKPKWLNTHIFIFLCPHCRDIWLSCKNIQMSIEDQINIINKECNFENVILDNEETCWTIRGSLILGTHLLSFLDMSITPSIDASKAGHWHGYITNGIIY